MNQMMQGETRRFLYISMNKVQTKKSKHTNTCDTSKHIMWWKRKYDKVEEVISVQSTQEFDASNYEGMHVRKVYPSSQLR